MDDSGVHFERDDRQSCRSMSGSFSESLSMMCESCDDCRYEVSYDSNLDITCREKPIFWTPTPRIKKAAKSRRTNSRRSNQKRKTHTQLRRSERLRLKSKHKFPMTTCCMSVSPIDQRSPSLSYSPTITACDYSDVSVHSMCDSRTQDNAELAFEDFGFLSYEDAMYEHRMNIEMLYHPTESLARQPKVTEGLRAVLVERLTKIHRRLDLKLDTLFLSVNVVDRFLITTPISNNCIELLGLTSTLVSCKMNEIFPPTISDLLVMSTESYTQTQIKQLERLVLTRLKFNLLAPTSIFFLEYHVHSHMRTLCYMNESFESIRKARFLARHMLELSLQDYTLSQVRPSLLALVALYQADNMLCQNTHFITTSGHTLEDMKACTEKFQPIVDGIMEHIADFDDIFAQYATAYGNDEHLL